MHSLKDEGKTATYACPKGWRAARERAISAGRSWADERWPDTPDPCGAWFDIEVPWWADDDQSVQLVALGRKAAKTRQQELVKAA